MQSKVLLAVVFTVCIDLLGLGILIPVIPQLLANPASPYYLLPAGWTVGQGYILLGCLTAIYPFMQFFATPILGELSDRFGRKPILTISLVGTSLSYIVFAIGIVTRSLPLLFFARAFDGVTGGNIAVAQAAIADITKPEDRAKNFGLIGAAFGVGFTLGPYLGGVLSDPAKVSWFTAATPFWFAAGLAFLNALSVVFLLPETLRTRAKDMVFHWTRALRNIVRAFGMKTLRPIFVSSFLFQAGFTFFTTFSSVFLISRFGWAQGEIGNYFAYIGVWIAISQAVVTRIVSGRWDARDIVSVSLFGTGLFILAQFLPTSAWGLLAIVPLFAIFTGLTQANMTSLVSRSAGASVQGEILGINSSVQALAQTIPPVLSGFIAASIGATVPVLVAGITIMLAGVVFVLWYRPLSRVS